VWGFDMKVIQIEHNPSRRQLNVFGIIWLVFFGVVGGIATTNGGSMLVATVIWGLAVAVPVVGWIVPAFMRITYIGMAYAAFPIGFVVSCLILAVVYYLVLTPTGLLMRLFGHDPMNRQFDERADTYWSRREQDHNLEAYFRQF
jgi:hypothetical protein